MCAYNSSSDYSAYGLYCYRRVYVSNCKNNNINNKQTETKIKINKHIVLDCFV